MREDSPVVHRAVPGSFSRRRDVRLDAPRLLKVSLSTAQGPFTLKDISILGLCFVADAPLALRSVHRVTLTLGRHTFTHRATVVHCRQHAAGGWLMGMEFVGEAPPQLLTIDDLIDEIVATSVTFYY